MTVLLPNISFEFLWCLTCAFLCVTMVVLKRLACINSRLSIACDSAYTRGSIWLELRNLEELSSAIICRNQYLEEHLLKGVSFPTSLSKATLPQRPIEPNLHLTDSKSIFQKAVKDLIVNTQASGVGFIDLIGNASITSSAVPPHILNSITIKAQLVYNTLEQADSSADMVQDTSTGCIVPSFNLDCDSELKFYGLSLLQVIPLAWEERSQQHRAILWLTHNTSQKPSKLENVIIQTISREVQRDLLSLKAYSQLDYEKQQAQIVSDERLRFISHLSHDLRTPLANIQNLFYMLLSKNHPEDSSEANELSELLEIGIDNCVRLNGMLSDVLDFTKHQAGRLKASPVKANLNQIIKEIISENSLKAQQQEVSFFTEDGTMEGFALTGKFTKEDCAEVFADIRHLRRILLNLIVNAINHCPRSTISISFKLTSNNKTCLLIKDTGPGIPPDRLNKILNPYGSSTGSGYGLGLVLTKGLSELNGIDLSINSTLGIGTTVELIIPRWKES